MSQWGDLLGQSGHNRHIKKINFIFKLTTEPTSSINTANQSFKLNPMQKNNHILICLICRYHNKNTGVIRTTSK